MIKNLEDLNELYLYIKQHELAKDDRIGIAGTSMGGITVSAALTRYPWIKAAGIMMGSARISDMASYLLESIRKQGVDLPLTQQEINQQLTSLEPIDLSRQLDKLADRPILYGMVSTTRLYHTNILCRLLNNSKLVVILKIVFSLYQNQIVIIK